MRFFIATVTWISAMVMLIHGQQSYASDYGCQVLLCLSNPRGPRAESACVPPINKLFDDLRRGKIFPLCDIAGGSGRGSYAIQGESWYDNCPPGTSALPVGMHAVAKGKENELLYGIGEQINLSHSTDSDFNITSAPKKICVSGNPVGSVSFNSNDEWITATIYPNVMIISPAKTPNFFDVYVEGKIYRRIRW